MRSVIPGIAAVLAALILAVALGPVAAVAQTPGLSSLSGGGEAGTASAPVALPDPLTPEAVDALVSRLSDSEVRTLLLDRLDSVAEEQATTRMGGYETLGALLGEMMRRIGRTVEFHVTHAPQFLSAQVHVLSEFYANLGFHGFIQSLLALALAVAAGFAAERLLAARVSKGVEDQELLPGNLMLTMRRACWRLLREVLGALVFSVAAVIVLLLVKPEGQSPVLPQLLIWLVLMPRFALALLRFFFAPGRRDLRLLSVGDHDARVLFLGFTGTIYVVGFTFALVALNQSFGGVPGFWFWFNVFFFGGLAVFFVVTRDAWRSVIQGGRTQISSLEARVIWAYPWVAVFAVVAVWVFCFGAIVMNAGGLLAGGRHFVSLIILVGAPLLDTLIHAVVRHYMPEMDGDGEEASEAYCASYRAYIRIGRVLIFGAVLLISARLWQLTPVAMASAGVGEQLATTTVRVGLIAVCGYVCWEVVRLMFNLRLAREEAAVTDDEPHFEGEGMGGKPTSRLGTILPPISLSLQILVLSVTALMILANIGIDVTALLAGAGIVGIAIGFGAQKLVSDVISGMFFLIDDAFRMNEYVDAGGSVGTVDRISLRSLRLRDSKGPVLIVPYSEIKTVTNYGRDWGIMKLRFTVPFDTDVEKVRKMFKKIGQELLEDPELGPGFIEPFKSQGVYEYNDHGIVIRGKFTHKPGAQFMIRKKVYLRVKEEFEKAGIEFARREVKVNLENGGGEGKLTEDQKARVSAAAAESVNEADRAAEAEAAAKANGGGRPADTR